MSRNLEIPAETAPDSLRDRKKAHLRTRIAAAALKLVHARGLARVSAENIARAVDIGRATFFRYFDSKEAAAVAGYYDQQLAHMVGALAGAPAAAPPVDAIAWAFQRMALDIPRQKELVMLQGRAVAASPVLRARSLEYQMRYEDAIATAVAPRFGASGASDLRPRLLAAAALAVARAATDHWVASGGAANLAAVLADSMEQLRRGFYGGGARVKSAPRVSRAASRRGGRRPKVV